MPRTILITGATSGIGKALAVEMAGRGYALGLAARRREVLEQVREDIRKRHPKLTVVIQPVDVTDCDAVPGAIRAIDENLGGVDIVFVNAGVGLGEKVGNGQFEKSKTTLLTNLLGAAATIDAAAALFIKRGSGHIVGVSSVAAFRGMPRSAAYSASKAGLAVYLEALRAELYGKNIDITVLYPGYIDTPLNNMLPSRPFLISVEKGASIIADLIEKKVKRSTVPVFPWNFIGVLLKLLPTGLIAKLAG
ncbi:MAG: SDR family oxidoreductase [Thermodesulfobacteriota bacterium]